MAKDNDTPTQPPESEADPQGQAALLLVESLCHILLEKQVLARADVIEAVETAADVKLEIALEGQERLAIAKQSLAYLKAIQLSLESDGKPPNAGEFVKH